MLLRERCRAQKTAFLPRSAALNWPNHYAVRQHRHMRCWARTASSIRPNPRTNYSLTHLRTLNCRRHNHSLSQLDPQQMVNRVFTPLNYSFELYSSTYRKNLQALSSSLKDLDLTNTVNHITSLSKTSLEFPKAGSLIHFRSDPTTGPNSFGIVLTDLDFHLSQFTTCKVLLPNSDVISLEQEDILFVIPEFIKLDHLKQLVHDNTDLPALYRAQLTFTLNVLLLFFNEVTNKILSEDLIRTAYLKTAFVNYQSSLNLGEFSKAIHATSQSLRNILNISSNPFAVHALQLSCHFLLYNDPIHFRFVKWRTSMYSILNPMAQISTFYFMNPILLAENIENVFNQNNDIIKRSYYDILLKRNQFQIFNIIKTDENFKRLILLIKYAIVNPHSKLLKKLESLLPTEIPLSSSILFKYLKELGIYTEHTNPILASGVYGFNMNDPEDLSLGIQSVQELQYSYNKGLAISDLPTHMQRYRPLKPHNRDPNEELAISRRFENKNFSNDFIKIIQNTKGKIWEHVEKGHVRKVYKIDDNIAFSVDQVSLTKYRFNIFVPIPNQAPNENITVQEPIRVGGNIESFPKLDRFLHGLRVNQPCMKLTFNHNLIDSQSLVAPVIKVGLDVFRKVEKVDDDWFKNRNPINLQGSKSKMDCWLALNKLFNLLIEKEKSRIRLGYLKTFRTGSDTTKDIELFKQFFIDNQSGNTNEELIAKYHNRTDSMSPSPLAEEMNNSQDDICSDDDSDSDESMGVYRDRQWIIQSLKLLIDENLARFCAEKGIKVMSRNLQKAIPNSKDYKVFRKFKIFRWYANSYETFGFQLSSTPGDLTAFVGCLAFLGHLDLRLEMDLPESREKSGYLPLGLGHFASFTSLNYIESHLNQWQLFRYLAIHCFQMTDERDDRWNPQRLQTVTDEHYRKCISQSEGYIEIMNKLNRFEILKGIQNDISGGTDSLKYGNGNGNGEDSNSYTLMRCVVTKITSDNVFAYWIEKDVEVEIRNDQFALTRPSIGDRHLCSEIKLVDPIEDRIIVQ